MVDGGAAAAAAVEDVGGGNFYKRESKIQEARRCRTRDQARVGPPPAAPASGRTVLSPHQTPCPARVTERR